ncbi:MAG: ankyrin repeat domain-containing protein [Gammaproteobacteria bacterium]
MINSSQGVRIRKLHIFRKCDKHSDDGLTLKSRGVGVEQTEPMLSGGGFCQGDVLRWLYASMQKEQCGPSFEELSEKISSYSDLDIEEIVKNHYIWLECKDPKLEIYHNNYIELLSYFSEILILQNASAIDPTLNQSDFKIIYDEYFKSKTEDEIVSRFNFAGLLAFQQIDDLISILPHAVGEKLFICSLDHAMGAIALEDNKFLFYDPNHTERKGKICLSAKELAIEFMFSADSHRNLNHFFNIVIFSSKKAKSPEYPSLNCIFDKLNETARFLNMTPLEECSHQGKSSLYFAIESGQTDTVKLYLDKIQKTSLNLNKLLILLCSLSRLDMFRLVLKKFNLNEIPLRKVLMSVIASDKVEFLEELVQKGLDLNYHIGPTSLLSMSTTMNSRNITEYLSKMGAILNNSLETTEGLLITLIQFKQEEMAKKLLSENIELFNLRVNGFTILYHAISSGAAEIVDLIINSNFDLNLCKNEFLLFNAIEAGNYTIARKIFEKINIQDHQEELRAIIQFAHSKTDPEFQEILRVVNYRPLSEVIEKGDVQLLMQMHSLGFDINRKCINESYFDIALRKDSMDSTINMTICILKLWEDKFDKNEQLHLNPLLLRAQRYNNANVVSYLLENFSSQKILIQSLGLLPNSIYLNQIAMVKLFIENGADINQKHHNGETPLMIAAIYSTEIFQVLLANNPDLSITDNNGRDINSILNSLRDDFPGKIDKIKILNTHISKALPKQNSILTQYKGDGPTQNPKTEDQSDKNIEINPAQKNKKLQ